MAQFSEAERKIKRFVQFAPDSKNPNAPGTYGWGFDLNGFRIVMYGPKEFDHPVVKSIDSNLQSKLHRGEEHGQAHVHVIDKDSGRESKYELIQHIDPANNSVKLLANEGKSKTPLTCAQHNAVFPVLEENANRFIQLWQEFYEQCKLGNNVTRFSEKYPRHQERLKVKKQGEKLVELENIKTGQIASMPFDDYVKLPISPKAGRG